MIYNKISLIKQLASAGADILELNTIRKTISAVKGGKLALESKAKMISLIISDIIGSPLDFIASGPTVENNDNRTMVDDVIQKYKIKLPSSVEEVLQKSNENNSGDFSHVYNYIIGDFRNKHVNTSLFLETFSLIDKNIFLADEPRFFIFLFNLKLC